jgi:hypothetical protein
MNAINDSRRVSPLAQGDVIQRATRKSKDMRQLLFVAVVVLTVLKGSAEERTQRPRIYDLGTLGGDVALAFAINDSPQAAG